MIRRIGLKKFKCFDVLKLPLSELTLLSGSNAAGKSTVLQALVLLHQTIIENEWASRLSLNGRLLRLGTVQDVVNKVHGRRSFSIALTNEDETFKWKFEGEKHEMSMDIRYGQDGHWVHAGAGSLHKLFPQSPSQSPGDLVRGLEGLTYITAERIGPQDFYPVEDREGGATVGPKGEGAVSRLYLLGDKPVSDLVAVPDAAPTLMRQLEAWMQRFFPECGIEVAPIARMNAVTLGIRTTNQTDYHRPINVGFGLTQILPILVAALSADPGDLVLIENPEVHLHPAGQALMGSFLALVASSGPQLVLETHSDHILNGIRRAVRQGVLSPGQVSLHFFQAPKPGNESVVSPQLDKAGNIDVWPDGFFDQYDKDMNHFAGWGE